MSWVGFQFVTISRFEPIAFRLKHTICGLFLLLNLVCDDCICGLTELYGDAGMRSLLQQLASNPQTMTNMLQAPYVQSMLNAMSSCPELVEQVTHSFTQLSLLCSNALTDYALIPFLGLSKWFHSTTAC